MCSRSVYICLVNYRNKFKFVVYYCIYRLTLMEFYHSKISVALLVITNLLVSLILGELLLHHFGMTAI